MVLHYTIKVWETTVFNDSKPAYFNLRTSQEHISSHVSDHA
jgi:hypothetical protein